MFLGMLKVQLTAYTCVEIGAQCAKLLLTATWRGINAVNKVFGAADDSLGRYLTSTGIYSASIYAAE
jgi:hypothetical protein